MFTQQQILNALSRVKTGADYPRLVQELKLLGIVKYDHFVVDGSNIYFGADNYRVLIEHDQGPISVSKDSSSDKLKEALRIHQAGQTDYPTFCIQAGEAGVEKWECDLERMAVSYVDGKGKVLVVESIPEMTSGPGASSH